MSEKKFFVGVKGVLIKDNKVLLIKGNQKVEGRDHWEVPGGRIDDDETIDEALAREFKEEVNGTNLVKHEIVHAHRVERDIAENTSLMLIFFRVTADISEVMLSHEHVEHQWLSEEEAIKLAHPNVAIAISRAFDLLG